MKDLVKKVAVGLTTGVLVAQAMVLPSFAAINVQVTGNGSNTDNDVDVNQSNTTVVEQSNEADIKNDIKASATTGNNSAGDNTGGDVSIDTGNAETSVTVSNAVNTNEASVACGGCPTDVNAVISGNGSNSENDVDLDLSNETFVTQENNARIRNEVEANASTGRNDADDNTGGDISIDTGSASTNVEITNSANANVASVAGGNSDSELNLWITGNGSDSENDLDVDLGNSVVLDQENWARIWNDVEADASTGWNEVDDSTGGIVSIDTGNADVGVTVDNMANFNLAHVEDCCELDGLIKVAGNGTKSENDVDFDYETFLGNIQNNEFKQGNDVDADAKTGKNEVDDSTGSVHGDPSIDTGSASNEVEVNTVGNSNIFSTGDGVSNDGEWWEDWSFENGNMFVWLMAMMSH